MATVLKLFSYLKRWIIYRSEAYKIFNQKKDKYYTTNENTGLFRMFREKDLLKGRAKMVHGDEEKQKVLSQEKIY